jgi:predicted aspartyl protease
MVKLDLKYGLPFCKITLIYKGKSMKLGNVLIDTGSVGTILKMDRVDELGITIEKDDTIETISGVGGIEFVYKKNIDGIKLGNLVISNFIIEVGAMDYGFEINGIIGMNFLREAGAIINLGKMAIYD